jgi:hypothetical protein
MARNKSKKGKKTARKLTAVTRGIEREIRKENGTLTTSRGIHTVHKSRAEKRRNRRTDRQSAIRDSQED